MLGRWMACIEPAAGTSGAASLGPACVVERATDGEARAEALVYRGRRADAYDPTVVRAGAFAEPAAAAPSSAARLTFSCIVPVDGA
jgi:hypothetical protein